MAKQLNDIERQHALQEGMDNLNLLESVASPPNMGNWTPEFMVDLAGSMKIYESLTKKWIKTLNDMIDMKVARHAVENKTPPPSDVKGEKFSMKIIPMTQMRVGNASAEATVGALCDEINKLRARLGDPLLTQKEILEWKDALKAPVDMAQHRYEKV